MRKLLIKLNCFYYYRIKIPVNKILDILEYGNYMKAEYGENWKDLLG